MFKNMFWVKNITGKYKQVTFNEGFPDAPNVARAN